MKNYEIKNRKKIVIQYYAYCPVCGVEIKGNSASHVDVNMKFHLDHKHPEEK